MGIIMRLARHSNFRADNRATAAVEFAYIAPVLIALFLGGFAISRGFNAMQKVDFIAHNLADLTARTIDCSGNASSACLTAANVEDIFKAADILLSPLPNAGLKITLSEVGVFQSGTGRRIETIWSITRNGAIRPCNTAPVLPDGFSAATAPLGAIVIVDVSYPFSPGPGFETYAWNFKRSNYAVARNLLPAAANSGLPDGHIANQSGEGTNCK